MCGPGSGKTVIQVTDGLLKVCSHPTSCLVFHHRNFTNSRFRILGLDTIIKELELLRISVVSICANIF